MKTKTLLIAAVMFLGLAAAAVAQTTTAATFSVGSIPVTAVVSTGETELTGAITFTQQPGGATVDGTISINYGVAITEPNLKAAPALVSSSLAGGATCTAPTVNPTASSNANGILVINVPAGCTSGAFSVSGVRVNVAGTTLSNLTATISSTGNAITAGQTSVVVISSIAAGISGVCSSTSSSSCFGAGSTVSINSYTGSITGTSVANIVVKEGFLNAFGDPANQTEAGLRITLSALPAAGITLTFPAQVFSYRQSDNSGPTAAWETMNSDGTLINTPVQITSTSPTLAVFYRAVSKTDPTQLEFVQIPVTVSVNSDVVSTPIAVGTITATVSMAPILPAFNPDGSVDTNPAHTPRYIAAEVGPTNLLSITANTTTILLPFVQTVTALGYNTGIAVANTTEDPGTTVMGFRGATAQSGAITFYFFPALPASGTNPANFNYTTTAGSPGNGLDSTGKVPAGGTYTVLLSQLLAAAGQPADFVGYMFVVTNFTNAHSLFVVSNFSTFSQGALGLVLNGSDRRVTSTAPEGLNN